MYFHFLQQFLVFLSLFEGESKTSDFLNSTTWEGENSSAIWSFQQLKDLHIIPTEFDSFTELLPVCCDVKAEPFHCKSNEISTPDQNSKQSNLTLERFRFSIPNCSNGNKSILFDPKFAENQTTFLRNGYFRHNNEFYSPREYCINRLTGEEFVEVKICEAKCSEERPCIQKCCDLDEIYSFKERKCIKSKSVSGIIFYPTFYKDMSNKVGKEEEKSPHFTVKFPRSFKYHCEGNMTQILPRGNLFADYLSNTTGSKYFPADFRIKQDGTILYRKDGKAIVLPDGHPVFLKENSRKCYRLITKHYCIDGGDIGDPNRSFSNEEEQTFLATCSELLYEPPVIGPLSFVYGNVMIGSSFFSLMTVLVYLTLKEKRNLYGLSVISYASSMFFMYIFLGLAHLIRYYGSDEVLKSNACVFIGIASHLFSLSSFLWLTMMNWDLWWTFRKIRPTIKSEAKLWTRYLKYSIFGWVIPILIVIVSSYLHFSYEEAVEEDCYEMQLPLPAYGRESCEIKQLSLGAYLYVPASALFLCNLAFFIATTHSLCKYRKKTVVAIKGMEERQHQSIKLFGKLFFVMGLTKVFEVITWYEGGLTLTWYYAIFDILNILQAVAIFIIYAYKKDVLEALKEKMLNWTCFVQDCFRLKNQVSCKRVASLSSRSFPRKSLV